MGSSRPCRLLASATLLLTVLTTGNASVATPASAAPRPAAPDSQPGLLWQWPLAGEPIVLRAFSRPPHRWNAGHRGLDLRAHTGQSVLAPRAGVVTFAGTVVDRGVVTITHPDGLRTSLEPLTPQVGVGARVSSGQLVGRLSTGGHCGTGCLHWGIRRGQVYLDPMLVTGPRRFAVLKPWSAASDTR